MPYIEHPSTSADELYWHVVNKERPVIMNHTTLRVKDYKASLAFYINTMKLKVAKVLHICGLSYYIMVPKFDLCYTERIGTLILCHQPGTETDPNFKVNTGDGESLGFASLYFSGDSDDTSDLLCCVGPENMKESVGIDGVMRTFSLTDPDGYRIIWKHNMHRRSREKLEYLMITRTVLRVKNPIECMEFYRNVLGMKLYVRHDDEKARLTLYFLGHLHDYEDIFDPFNFEGSMDLGDIHYRRGIIELQHLWDTPEISIKDGNSGSFDGFSHIGFSVIDLHEYCMELETQRGVNLDWTVDSNGEGTEIRVKTKDPEGNAIHFISRTYYVEAGDSGFESDGFTYSGLHEFYRKMVLNE